MSTVKTVRLMALWVVLAGIAAMPIFAEDASIETKMNKEIKVDLKDVMITEALDKIGKEVDVPIKLSDEAEWKLPYGKSTRLSVSLKGPASEALTQMLNEFFMRYAVGQDEITIFPRPELDHIIGRPSARQLNVLKAIYTKPIQVYITDNVSGTVNAALDQEVFISPISLHGEINNVLRALAGERKFEIGRYTESNKPVWQVMLPPDSNGKELKEYPLPTAVTFSQLLREVHIGGNLVEWYIPAIELPNQLPEIRIVKTGTLETLNREQLIDVNYEDIPLLEIFQNLANRGGIFFERKSDIAHYLDQQVTISIQNVTAMQAMKRIADMSHLVYDWADRQFAIIRIANPPKADSQAVGLEPSVMMKSGLDSTARGPYVGKISIPMEGGKYYIEYMLRESDLTEKLKKLRSEKIAEILGTPPKEDSMPKPTTPAPTEPKK